MSFTESDYENAFISMLESEGWQYLRGSSIPRSSQREVLYVDDFEQFLSRSKPELTPEDIRKVIDSFRLVGAESEFAALHKIYNMLVNGVRLIHQDGSPEMIDLIDFVKPYENIFRVVNQFEVEYSNSGQVETRRPDVLLFVNGIPLCIIELKNPANENATIYDAWKQIHTRYWRDIPHLLHYCPVACISDGVNTRLGTVRSPYEHFYAWKKVNHDDKIASGSFEQTQSMIKGVFEPARFLEILRDYIYFPDFNYDNEEREVICRYPQFFAARLLRDSIIKSINSHTNRGGTYFGATGCGKTFTMAFLARQLALRTGTSPTVIMIVDREDLQTQGANLFMKSTEFLNLGEVKVVESRKHLRSELKTRESGGFYICTIQKFCDRENDSIGEINKRNNIICFSDEAHRTQLDISRGFSLNDSTAKISRPYAQVLREAFPNAVFVGFSGTPIEATYQTFGEEVDRYTMDQAVSDGLTVPVKYHPRIARVLLDKEKISQIEEYYKSCAEQGATPESVQASKSAMSSMDVILSEPSRLERLAADIHDHYIDSCMNDPERVQKAFVVCSNRHTAYKLLKIFMTRYPEWFIERKSPDDSKLAPEDLRELKPLPFMSMIASVDKDDEPDMYNYLGGVRNDKRNGELADSFKDDKSNFRIAIVVDMWITGFDVPSLTYLYNDKPLQKHMLIQTISRVNRKYPGKEYGLIIDYIGIRENMRQAVKLYGGESCVAPSEDDVQQAQDFFSEELFMLKKLFTGYDLGPFMNLDSGLDPSARYRLLARAAEYVFASTQYFKIETKNGKRVDSVIFREYFLRTVKRMRAAYDICQPSGVLTDEELSLAQCFMAVAGLVRKMNGTGDIDTDIMNRNVARMIEEALKYNKVESVFDESNLESESESESEDIFSPEYLDELKYIRMPATRLELLIKLLRKRIKEYGKTNRIAAKKFQEMLEDTIKKYHERRESLSAQEAGEAQEEASEKIIQDASEQARKILEALNEDRESFRKVGLTFGEKAFYDILMTLRDKYNFVYGKDQKLLDGVTVNDSCKSLAVKIKNIIDTRSSYSDWLNNQIVRDQLKFDIKVCLIKNGYPPQYSPEVFRQVMEQVENFKANND